MVYKMGKGPPKDNKLSLRFEDFLPADVLPPPPQKAYLEYKIPPEEIGMFGNADYGDCVFAMIAHWLMLITAHVGKMVTPTLKQVLDMYAAVTGFDPTTGAGDNGAAVTDALQYWKEVGIAGHKISGWAKIDHKNRIHRNIALDTFFGVGVGVQLPSSSQWQFMSRKTWTPVRGDRVAGGHAILESGYGRQGRNFESWGRGDQKANNAWDSQSTDEAYIVLTPDLIDKASGLSPNGLNWATLNARLKALAA